jgi:hypothetical protein
MCQIRSSDREEFEMDSLDHKTASVSSQRSPMHRVNVAVLGQSFEDPILKGHLLNGVSKELDIKNGCLGQNLVLTQACREPCCS